MNPAFERIAAVAVWAASAAPLWCWWMCRLSEPIGADAAAWAVLAVLIAMRWFNVSRSACRPAVWKIASAAAGLAAFHLSRLSLPFTASGVFCVVAAVPLLLPETGENSGAKTPAGEAPCIGLALLGLPSAMVVDLFLGIPLRALATGAAVFLLRIAGLPVVRQGLELSVGDVSVWVDVPCAGIRMLSAGLLAGFAFAALYRFGWGRTAVLSLLAVYAVVVTNVVRVVALTVFSVCGWDLSPAAHSAVGCALLLPAMAFVAFCAYFLDRRRP